MARDLQSTAVGSGDSSEATKPPHWPLGSLGSAEDCTLDTLMLDISGQ